MDASLSSPINEKLVTQLLTLPAVEDQIAVLQEANLYDAAGLQALTEYAAAITTRQPGDAAQLAALCASEAAVPIAPEVAPRAAYIQAQSHAINGRFVEARTLIETARDGYRALGQTTAALRTNIGLMNILGELGEYQEAITVGTDLLTAVQEDNIPTEEASLLAAKAAQNLGICYQRTGQYEAAVTAYGTAVTHYQTVGETEAIAHIQLNHGFTLIDMGQANDALALLEKAITHFAENTDLRMQAKARNNLGVAYQHLGQYAPALNQFTQARRLFDQINVPAEAHILLLDTAETYLALNLFPEAVAAYQEVLAVMEDAAGLHNVGRAQWGLGAALAAQGRFGDAAAALETAAEIFSAAGNAPFYAGVLLEQAALLARRNQKGAALRLAQRALGLTVGDQWPVQRVLAQMRIADLLLPDVASAQSWLLAARPLSEALPLPHLHYRLHQRLGRIYLLQGDDETALPLLETAVNEIEQLRSTLPGEAMRASFLQDKTAAYEDLVQLYLNRGDDISIQQAFAIAERAKSRSLVDLLLGLTDLQLDETHDPDLSQRLAVLQAELNTLYNEVFNSGSGGERHIPLAQLQSQTSRLENEVSRLRLQLTAVKSPPTKETAPELPLPLPAKNCLLAYHIIGEEIVAFVRQNGRLQVVRQLSQVSTVQALLHRLTMQWDHFRAGRDFAARHQKQLERSTRRLLQALYAELVAPLTAVLPTGTPAAPTPLIIIPHGLLHQIPFHALCDGQTYLLENYEICYAPSATVYALCQQTQPTGHGRTLVMGVNDGRIPHVNAETQAVVQHTPQAQLLLNETATLAAFKANAEDSAQIHLACHGLFRGDNPMFSALKLNDGWLTAAEILELDLAGAFVTLSACESGRAAVLAGDEMIGLARAFLGAGAAALVVSQWLVEDDTTARLMADWYGRLARQQNRSAALRAAQLALKETHPHPYYWAPFILVGQS